MNIIACQRASQRWCEHFHIHPYLLATWLSSPELHCFSFSQSGEVLICSRAFIPGTLFPTTLFLPTLCLFFLPQHRCNFFNKILEKSKSELGKPCHPNTSSISSQHLSRFLIFNFYDYLLISMSSTRLCSPSGQYHLWSTYCSISELLLGSDTQRILSILVYWINEWKNARGKFLRG